MKELVDVEEDFLANSCQSVSQNFGKSESRVEKMLDFVDQLLEQYRGTLLGQVGNTPLVRLKRANTSPQLELYAKLEGYNPSGSLKDRIVLFLIASLMAEGKLDGENQVLVEASSGNTGIALALFGAVLGRKVLITMPDDVSPERRKLIRSYGSELILTPGEKGTDGAIEEAQKLDEKEGYLWIAQHYREANPLAHYYTTARELLEELERIDTFVAPSGTTGTLMGIGRRLKDENFSIQIVSVWPKEEIMGLRRPVGNEKPGIYQEDWIDEIVEVKNEEAKQASKELAKLEGIFAGPSSGASLVGARWTAKKIEEPGKNKKIVALFPDGGERYLSTDTFDYRGD